MLKLFNINSEIRILLSKLALYINLIVRMIQKYILNLILQYLYI